MSDYRTQIASECIDSIISDGSLRERLSECFVHIGKIFDRLDELPHEKLLYNRLLADTDTTKATTLEIERAEQQLAIDILDWCYAIRLSDPADDVITMGDPDRIFRVGDDGPSRP